MNFAECLDVMAASCSLRPSDGIAYKSEILAVDISEFKQHSLFLRQTAFGYEFGADLVGEVIFRKLSAL